MSDGNSKYQALAQQQHLPFRLPFGAGGNTPPVAIDNVFYFKCVYKMQLLQNMGKLEPKEVANAIRMLDSKDEADWIVVEEIIKNKFLEI